MATTLSTAQYAALNHAISEYTIATAPENQLHEKVIQEVIPVMVATAFSADSGTAQQALRDRPLTTLLAFAAYLGKP